MTRQPAISFSGSFHFPFNRAGGRTSNVRPRKYLEIPFAMAQMGYNRTMKEATVRARVDSKLKSDAEAVFGTLGINTTEAIRMFLSQVRLRRGLPFIVGIPDNSDLLLPTQMRQDAINSLYED